MKELLSEDSVAEAKKIIRSIALMTFSIEAFGAINLFFSIPSTLVPDSGDRLFIAIFTSISAFCNAGFSLFPDSLYNLSLHSSYSIYTVMLLILFGGLGFPVLRDIVSVLRPRRRGVMPRRLEFTSRIVLITTGILLVVGFFGFIILEDDGVLAGLSTGNAGFIRFFIRLRRELPVSIRLPYLNSAFHLPFLRCFSCGSAHLPCRRPVASRRRRWP